MSSRGQPENLEAATRVYRQLQEAICGPAEHQSGAGSDKRAIAVLAHVMKPQSYRLPVDGQATLQQLLPRAANPHKLQQHYTLLESSGAPLLPEFAALLQELSRSPEAAAVLRQSDRGGMNGAAPRPALRSNRHEAGGSAAGSRASSLAGSAPASPSQRHRQQPQQQQASVFEAAHSPPHGVAVWTASSPASSPRGSPRASRDAAGDAGLPPAYSVHRAGSSGEAAEDGADSPGRSPARGSPRNGRPGGREAGFFSRGGGGGASSGASDASAAWLASQGVVDVGGPSARTTPRTKGLFERQLAAMGQAESPAAAAPTAMLSDGRAQPPQSRRERRPGSGLSQGAEAVLSAAREKVARARLGSGAGGADAAGGLRTPRASIAAPGSARSAAAAAAPGGWTPEAGSGSAAVNGGGPTSRPVSDHGNPLFGQDAATPLPKSWRAVGGGDAGPGGAAAARSGGAPAPVLAEIGDLWDQFPRLPEVASAETPPEWHVSRPHLTGYAIMQAAVSDRPPPAGLPLHSLPLEVQDATLVQDLLFAFDGLDGRYVRAGRVAAEGRPHLAFSLEAPGGRLDATLSEHVRMLLPICESVATLRRFVDVRSLPAWGGVSHALAAGLRQLLADWALFLAQLEHRALRGSLSLQALVSECQLPLRTLRLLAGLAARAAATAARGAPLLDLLAAAADSAAGDVAARPRLRALLEVAAAPYFRVLERWLTQGAVDDPFSEFMVCEQLDGPRDWRRFVLGTRPAADADDDSDAEPQQQQPRLVADVPAFLARSQDAVLATGTLLFPKNYIAQWRYINAVREAGLPVPAMLPPDEPLVFDVHGAFERAIRGAHSTASAAALRLLAAEAPGGGPSALAQLKTLQQVMLLQPGGWSSAFLEAAAAELTTPAGAASTDVLHATLLQELGAAGLPAQTLAALCVVCDHRSVLAMHTHALEGPQRFLAAAAAAQDQARALGRQSGGGDGVEGGAARQRAKAVPAVMRAHFMLSYEVAWPLSVLVTPLALAQYQSLFRLLFELAGVQRDLAAAAQLHKAVRRLPGAAVPVAAADCVRCAMKHTFDALRAYLASGVVAPALAALQGDLRAARTLEEAAVAHEACVARLLRGALLSRRPAALRHLQHCRQRVADFAAALSAPLAAGSLLGRGARTGKPRLDRRSPHAEAAAASLLGRLTGAAFRQQVDAAEQGFAADLQQLICELCAAHRAAREEGSAPRAELAALQELIAGLGADNGLAITVAVEDALADAGLKI